MHSSRNEKVDTLPFTATAQSNFFLTACLLTRCYLLHALCALIYKNVNAMYIYVINRKFIERISPNQYLNITHTRPTIIDNQICVTKVKASIFSFSALDIGMNAVRECSYS